MARTFGSGIYLLNTASACITTQPLTIACWFNYSSTGASNSVFLGHSSDYYGLVMGYSTAGRVGALLASIAVGEALAETSAAFTSNTWAHACAVFTSATSRTAYLNGGSSGTNTTSCAPASMTNQSIGCYYSGSAAWGLAYGTIAEVGMWNVALTASEVGALARGVPTTLIRPASIAGYWSLYGLDSPERDFQPGIVSTTRRALTMTGTAAQANNPPTAPTFFPRYTYGVSAEEAAPILIESAGAYASQTAYGGLPIICPVGF